MLISERSALLSALLLPQVTAWSALPIPTLRRHDSSSRRPVASTQLLSATSDSSTETLRGVTSFNSWFKSVAGAECSDSIQHADFDGLRGLEYTGSKLEIATSSNKPLLTVPRSVVLQTDFTASDWDAQLALQLWNAYKQGSTSSVSGYCDLLARQDASSSSSSTDIPPSTAPDALRRWTSEEKELLKGSDAGERVLALHQQQQDQWRFKHEANADIKNEITWEQFEWAMEVVHSRAFCGEFGMGSSPIPPIASTIAPLVAAVIGYVYFTTSAVDNLTVYLGLGALAIIPAIVNLVTASPPAAVLLPLIDSANHKEEAASVIDYDPLSNSFTLSVDPSCIIDEGGKKQLYITYGKKKDTELLLNYGFLEGIPDNDQNYRNTLAKTFLQRNSS